MKQKILYIITKSNFGGAQRYVYDLATALPKDQYEVAVACGGNGILTEKLKYAGIPIFEIKSFQRDINIKKEFDSLFELARIIREFRPDVVHLNSSKAGGSGALIARLLSIKKIIFTAHGWPFYEPRGVFWRSIVWALSYLTTLLVHQVIVVSEHDKVRARMPGLTKKIACIHTALPEIPFHTRVDARAFLCTHLGRTLSQNALWVGSIGEYVKNKNLLFALEAFNEVHTHTGQNLYYVLIGIDGDERPHLEQYIRDHNLSERVFLAGFIDNAREYLKAFDIFLMPSRKEGLPYGLLEAGQARRAVIASNVGGIPEVVTHKETGILIDPRTPTALTDALKTLVASPELREQYGERLAQKVMTNFALENMLIQTETLYEEKGSLAT